jgi:hypothetical protein
MTRLFNQDQGKRNIKFKISPSLASLFRSQSVSEVSTEMRQATRVAIKSAAEASEFFLRHTPNREKIRQANTYYQLIHRSGNDESRMQKFISTNPAYPLSKIQLESIQHDLMSLPISVVYEMIDKEQINADKLQQTKNRIEFIKLNWINKNNESNQFLQNLLDYHNRIKNKSEEKKHKMQIIFLHIDKILINRKISFINFFESFSQLETLFYSATALKSNIKYKKDISILLRHYALMILSMQVGQYSNSYDQERHLKNALLNPVFYKARTWYGRDHHTDAVSIIKKAIKQIQIAREKNTSIELSLIYAPNKKLKFSDEFVKECRFYI